MIKILSLFEQIGFLLQEDGTYIGYGYDENHGEIKFEFKKHYLICAIKNDTNPSVLFSFIYGDIEIGMLIVILQEYKIIRHDFVQNAVIEIEKSVKDYYKQLYE